MSSTASDKRWTWLLVALAFTFPVGAILLPLIAPSRSTQPVVSRSLAAPVVIVTVAGMQAQRVHHLGGERAITPSLDRLAELGTTFKNSYADSNFEAGTMAAMLTGQCTNAHGVERPDGTLSASAKTLPGHFESMGWTTAAIVANTANVGRGFEPHFERFDVAESAGAHDVVSRALTLIDELDEQSPRWFLWLDLGDLTAPYGRSPDIDPSAFAPNIPEGFGTSLNDYRITPAQRAARGTASTHGDWLSARYDAALADVDSAVGELMAGLDDHWFETITLVVAGTCGTRVNERPDLLGAHASDLYEHSTRVPLVYHMSSRYIRGLRSDAFVQPSDVMPTLLDLLLRRTPALPSKSMRPVMIQQNVMRRSAATDGWTRAGGTPWRGTALRTRDVKLIMDAEGEPREFYDLNDDPRERSGRRLNAEQASWMIDSADWAPDCR